MMTAETYSASLVNRLSISAKHHLPQGYYRSKLFTASFATNPLIAAAGPLLSLLERLGISTNLPPVNEIRDNIQHELYAFQSRLTGQELAEELIVIAHYLVCATTDELLGKNYERVHGSIAEFKAFTPSSLDGIGPQQRFFEIVSFLKERINQYLDILELAYYCLIAGFEGEQHLKSDGRQALDNLIEELYLLIQQHRVYKPHQLFKEQINSLPEKINYRPFLTAGILAIGLLAGFYLSSHALLEYKARNVFEEHITLAHAER